MWYVICILISVFLSSIYTNIRLNQMNKINDEYLQKYSLETFEAVIKLLKKCGVLKK